MNKKVDETCFFIVENDNSDEWKTWSITEANIDK